MFLLVTALISALAGPPNGSAQEVAPPIDLIATLNQVCVAAQGDRARAAALAAEAGFSPVPAGMVPRMRNSSETTGFMRSNATDISFVMTGKMTRRVGGETLVMDFCGVSARPTDHRALNTVLRERMGFAPVRSGGTEAYAWLQMPEGRAPARSLTDAEFLAMAETGQMQMVGLDRSGPGSTLIYFLPRLD
ncbi:hypothetical protein [Brevundimonas sp.]|uniref:hypothetical protein n=1 Tax=Brevundimonas sp. TaxID=1871086 RepID=UPI002B8DA30D|nr:hypothetical protein [Brevundimonas sp.]HWQ88101.1 hypothetical protein [Brevundimonas sp.]